METSKLKINPERYWNVVDLQNKHGNSYRDWEGFWDAEGLEKQVDRVLENYKGLDYSEELLEAVKDITMNLAYEIGDHSDPEDVTDEYIANTMYVVLEMLTCKDWMKSTAK